VRLPNHFSIVVPSYNCKEWVEKCIQSILSQDYQNYNVFYIDDNSKDSTKEKVSLFKDARIKTYYNSYNKGKMQNIVEVSRDLQPDTIVVILDGDDWFYDNTVLSHLDSVYSDKDVWMTNGSYIIEPSNEVVSPELSYDYWDGTIRHKSWQFSHLGTFRKKLFDRVKIKDFMDKQGRYWATTSDQAIMWPLAEMCGPEHHRTINKVLYTYNRLNPMSDDRVNRQDQLETEYQIRNMKPYKRLEVL
jgi:glycosyltransferase involved in cell wall biosynthesis